jgi:hypothetical protein
VSHHFLEFAFAYLFELAFLLAGWLCSFMLLLAAERSPKKEKTRLEEKQELAAERTPKKEKTRLDTT